MVEAASPIQVFPQLLAGWGDWIGELPGWIEAAVARDPRLGYLALGLAMFLENLIPPIPSELIQPLGGVLVQQGRLELVPVILVGTAGTVLGCWFWYGLGRWFGEERLIRWIGLHGRRIGLDQEDLTASRTWFARHGVGLVFWGRLVPGIRTLISVPAGIEMMPFVPFMIWTTAGSLIWTLLLTLAGYGLGEAYTNVEVWLDPLAKVIKVLLVLAVLGFAVWLGLRTWKKRQDSH